MAVFRCKRCGGELTIVPGESLATCDYCGTQQTLPKVTDENLQGMFNRANALRMKAEFDKAAEIYDKILQSDGTEAEAYWGLILCKYGIEYVEDPATYKRVPTCHRASYDAVTADDDYKMAMQYADTMQRGVYEEEAKQIDEIQKGILSLAQKEAPYDVFICYKETDENGRRTQDSVIANDIYYQLTQEGYKVFYAAITLEDKLGQEYEPYIFSALNSARVMLSIGTKPEYFNAVWVKNEWSRFLKIMKKDRTRMLIPCYKDMDAYELPEEFAHLQAQDMSKIGFINDIVRGIKKVVVKEQEKNEPSVILQNISGGNSNAYVKRGKLALEDGDWDKADEFFEETLNQDAECAEAYLGKLMVKFKKSNIESLKKYYIAKYESTESEKLYAGKEEKERIDAGVARYKVKGYLEETEIRALYSYDRQYTSELLSRQKQKEQELDELSNDRFLKRAVQYATGDLKKYLDDMMSDITECLDMRIESAQKSDEEHISAIKRGYKEFLDKADEKAEQMNTAAIEKREEDYNLAIGMMKNAKTVADYTKVIELFKGVGLAEYKDSAKYAEQCEQKSKQESEYLVGISLMNAAKSIDNYEGVIKRFKKIEDYKDSSEYIEKCNQKIAKIREDEEREKQRIEEIWSYVKI